MAEPHLPRMSHDPTGLMSLEDKCSREFIRRIKGAHRKIITDVIEQIPVREITLNASAAYILNRQRTWRWELDQARMVQVEDMIEEIINEYLMSDEEGFPVSPYDPKRVWLFDTYVEAAYEKGTGEVFRNLNIQSDVYRAQYPDIQSVMLSEPYKRRAGLIASREYSLLKGFSDSMAKTTKEILTTAILKGDNPREVAKKLRERTPPEKDGKNHLDSASAIRIAQTEIPGALRQAKSDEAKEADEKFGIRSMLMPLSAFMETSRPWHMARHGKLVTYEEQAEFYSEAKNAINCHCSAIVVVLGRDGKPVAPGLVQKAAQQRIHRMGK